MKLKIVTTISGYVCLTLHFLHYIFLRVTKRVTKKRWSTDRFKRQNRTPYEISTVNFKWSLVKGWKCNFV